MFGTRLLQKRSSGGARALEEELLLGVSALDLKTARTPLLFIKKRLLLLKYLVRFI
jgi:hypothetical protein